MSLVSCIHAALSGCFGMTDFFDGALPLMYGKIPFLPAPPDGSRAHAHAGHRIGAGCDRVMRQQLAPCSPPANPGAKRRRLHINASAIVVYIALRHSAGIHLGVRSCLTL
jgi:hypothetical protein